MAALHFSIAMLHGRIAQAVTWPAGMGFTQLTSAC